ncbi:hypothetical protein FZEAL_4953 [Fusarium zealandicum]|uniref:Uncharacterized protein n=1 Tax=Fusarium zealandicum TaxID=1053134 RepID=A0A8H4UL84_9HYPO|nr:hypothetical protein FZEAL_4953 [Fusarium zealandicum]
MLHYGDFWQLSKLRWRTPAPESLKQGFTSKDLNYIYAVKGIDELDARGMSSTTPVFVTETASADVGGRGTGLLQEFIGLGGNYGIARRVSPSNARSAGRPFSVVPSLKVDDYASLPHFRRTAMQAQANVNRISYIDTLPISEARSTMAKALTERCTMVPTLQVKRCTWLESQGLSASAAYNQNFP